MGTNFLISATISGGNIRCPWYFLLAQPACAPLRPSPYAEIKRADRFAKLIT